MAHLVLGNGFHGNQDYLEGTMDGFFTSFTIALLFFSPAPRGQSLSS